MAAMLFVTSLRKMSIMLFCHIPGYHGNNVILLILGQDVNNVILLHPWTRSQECYFVTPG